MIEALVGFAAVLALVLLRMPIAFAMGLVGMLGYMHLNSYRGAISMVGRLTIDATQNYGLSVVPLFILMGLFVNKGGLSRELYRASHAFLGHFRGGLAMATICACAGFSAICGSSLATAATMSKVAMPQMRRFGYDDSLSTASIAAGGTLGILIPPSVILVIYGLLTETSIGKLFIAGILPGLLGVLCYLAAVRFTVARRPEAGPAGERTTWGGPGTGVAQRLGRAPPVSTSSSAASTARSTFGRSISRSSPTEAAGMGAMGAFLIALARGALTVRDTFEVLREAAFTTASLFTVLIGAWVFSNFVNLAGLPEGLRALVTDHAVSPAAVMLLILLVYLALGCVFESLSMLLLTVPIFFPLVISLGYDPVWFGIIVVVVTEISLITPPVGLNVFVLRGVVPDVSTGTVFRGRDPVLDRRHLSPRPARHAALARPRPPQLHVTPPSVQTAPSRRGRPDAPRGRGGREAAVERRRHASNSASRTRFDTDVSTRLLRANSFRATFTESRKDSCAKTLSRNFRRRGRGTRGRHPATGGRGIAATFAGLRPRRGGGRRSSCSSGARWGPGRPGRRGRGGRRTRCTSPRCGP